MALANRGDDDPLPIAAGTGIMYRQDGAVLTPAFAAVSAAGNGDNTLVAAVAGLQIRVVALFLWAAGTVTVTVQDGASGTALIGAVPMLAQTGFVLPFNQVGWCQTSAGNLLNLHLSTGVSVAGALVYVTV